MRVFDMQPCYEIGVIKNAIKEAILDGIIPNSYNEAYEFMLAEAAKMGLKPKENQ